MADTDALIQQALKDEEAEKKLKKQNKHAQDQQRKVARKGKTLEQIESEEGGPVKESMVGMAQTKRAQRRKGSGGGVDDTDIPEDVEGIEEELEVEEEDGIKLEAFNLKEERQRGYFDEAGNYVEREDKDAEEADDAWLQSDEAKVVSAEVRRKIEERQKALAAAEAAAGPLSATQIARLQLQASQLLEPGESVAAGLKRLGGHSRRPAKRSKRKAGGGEEGGADMAADPAARQKFNQLTEVAMKLMDAGENDVYTQTKEYFERAAAVYIDLPGPSSMLDAGPSKAAYEDADEDMFASDEEKAAAEPKLEQQQTGVPAAAAPAQQAAAAAAPPAAAAAQGAAPPAVKKSEDETDYSSWPVKELRRFLTERGVDSAGIIEKEDLVAKVKEVAAAGPEGEAPAGYVFDPATRYYYSADTGMYWDATSGGFYSSSDGRWYSWDADKQQFVEWAQQPQQ